MKKAIVLNLVLDGVEKEDVRRSMGFGGVVGAMVYATVRMYAYIFPSCKSWAISYGLQQPTCGLQIMYIYNNHLYYNILGK